MKYLVVRGGDLARVFTTIAEARKFAESGGVLFEIGMMIRREITPDRPGRDTGCGAFALGVYTGPNVDSLSLCALCARTRECSLTAEY